MKKLLSLAVAPMLALFGAAGAAPAPSPKPRCTVSVQMGSKLVNRTVPLTGTMRVSDAISALKNLHIDISCQVLFLKPMATTGSPPWEFINWASICQGVNRETDYLLNNGDSIMIMERGVINSRFQVYRVVVPRK